MHTDFLIYQFARNIIRSELCDIILHAWIEYKRNSDLFYSLNVYKKIENTEVVTQNGQSIETGNAGHTRQRIKTKQKPK